MKKIVIIISAVVFVLLNTYSVKAEEAYDLGTDTLSELEEAIDIDGMYERLPEQSKESLDRMGLSGSSVETLSDVSFSSVMGEILRMLSAESVTAFTSLAVMLGVMLLYTFAESFTLSLSNGTLYKVLSVVAALSISCVLVIPVTDIITEAANVVKISSDLMLSMIPIMVTVLISAGGSVTGSEYYTMMIAAASGISRLYSQFVTPLLSVFLGVSVCTTVMPDLKFNGLVSFFSKMIKWVLSFTFTVFTALLSLKTLVSSSVDKVTSKAMKYTVASFVPVVGSALSEAYKTVLSSVGILKNGVGVFVIFALGTVFLPLIIKLLIWQMSIGLSRSFAEMISLKVPCELLGGVSSVLATLFSILLCIMALFIISTALIITAGGGVSL